MNFIIRQAKASDAEAISALAANLAHFFIADSTSLQVSSFLASLMQSAYAERIEMSNFTHYVAEDSTGICGIIALRDGAHVYHLFVKAQTHRQGIARALWEHAKGLSVNSMFTVNSSLFAVPVYERFGFVVNAPPQTVNGLVFVPMVYTHDS